MNQDTIKKYNLDLYDVTEVVGKYDVPNRFVRTDNVKIDIAKMIKKDVISPA